MFQHFARSLPLHRASFTLRSRGPPTRILFGISAGTLLYLSALRTIHADSGEIDRRSGDPNDLNELSEKRLDSTGERSVADILRSSAQSSTSDRGSGVLRVDSIVVGSNLPSEDFISTGSYPLPSQFWSLFGIYDGHNGPATSFYLAHNLASAVVGALSDLFSLQPPLPEEHTELGLEPGRTPPSPESIDDTIKHTFLRFDEVIVQDVVDMVFSRPSKERATTLLARAHAGSCALLAFYESDTRRLRVAVTGDSRAVLGRRVANGSGKESYEVHVLSLDQNAHNPAEEARMSALHPGEKIMDNGRVLGWGMSRAFGDATYKWSREIQERLHQEYLGDRVRPNVKTPPYFTAEPEITTTEVQPGDFLVMASDGLWDCLTNEEAVGLVGVWLRNNNLSQTVSDLPSRKLTAGTDAQIIERDELPVELREDKTVMYPWWRTAKRFLNVDDNAAAHLTRNALGGADRDLTAALLAMTPPRSRRYRDDISVHVVFFE